MRRKKQYLNDGNQEYRKIQANLEKEKKIQRNRKLKKRFKILIIIFLISILGFLLFKYNESEYSNITNIEITGTQTYTSEEILNKINMGNETKIFTTYSYFIDKQILDLPGVESIDTQINYLDRVVKIDIKEYNVMAYTQDLIYYENGSKRENTTKSQYSAPLLVGFEEELPLDFIPSLEKVDEASYQAISEIRRIGDKFDDNYLQLVMDNNYNVYTNIAGMKLLNKNYATIITENDDPEKRCIIIKNEASTPVAVLKKCD